MSSDSYRPPAASVSKMAALGDLIFECRGRSAKKVLISQGFSEFSVYFQLVLYSFFCLMAVGAVLTNFLAKNPSPETLRTRQIIAFSIFLCILGLMSWVFFRRPKRGKLALHENGLRFRRRAIRWSEIRSIHSGRTLGSIESAVVSTNRFLGKFSPTNQAAAEISSRGIESSWTVVLKDGTRQILPVVLVYCEPEDIRRFFEILASRHPEIEVNLQPFAPMAEDARRPDDTTDNFFDGPSRKFRDI